MCFPSMILHAHLLYLKNILKNFDYFLLPCNDPTQIVKPLTVKKHLFSYPLDDKDKSYYTTLNKQTYSYNELLFISAKTISYMVQTEHQAEHKSHTSPIRNTPDKFSSAMSNRTLRDTTHLLEPYKRNPSDTPITTHTYYTAMRVRNQSWWDLDPLFLLGLGGTGIRWDIKGGTPFYT